MNEIAEQLKRIADILDPKVFTDRRMTQEWFDRMDAQEDEYERTHLKKKHWWSGQVFDG